MVNFNPRSHSLFIPSAQDVEKATREALENIEKQMKKMSPPKKPACATDNFPWIYDDPTQFKVHILNHAATFKNNFDRLSSDVALQQYKKSV